MTFDDRHRRAAAVQTPWVCLRLSVLASLVLATAAAPLVAGEFSQPALEFFEKEVRPLLAAKCFECHGQAKKLEGGLRLTARAGVLKGGESGPVVVPGKPKESLLVRAVRYDGDVQMPPNGKLSDSQIAGLTRWVELGLPWPDEGDPDKENTAQPAKPTGRDLSTVSDEQRAFWSFQPVKPGDVPTVQNRDWVRSGIDAFVLAQIEKQGLSPAPPADKRALLRRVTFDLIGLPPTPAETDEFLADESPQAFAKVVDRLLASVHYGERWGRHWLDVARYADSSGKDENHACGNAFRYRDYVVRALNNDKPFDRFVREQIAGDLLPQASESERYENLTATGFLQLGPKALAEQDKPKLLMDIADEQIDAVSRAFLGLTVACGRCHDHKLEPVPQRDYYALAGIFRSTRVMQDLGFVSEWLETPLADPAAVRRTAEYQKQVDENKKQLEDRVKQAQTAVEVAWRKDFARYLVVAQRHVAAKPSQDGSPKGDVAPATAELAKVTGANAAAADVKAAADPNVIDPALAELAKSKQLTPLILKRWVEFLGQPPAKRPEIFAIWRQFAAIDGPGFSAAAPRVIQALTAEHGADGKTTPVATLIVEALHRSPPKSLEDVAANFEQMAVIVDSPWHDALPKEAQEELRRILSGDKGIFAPPADARVYYAADDLAALVALEARRDALKTSAPPAVPTAMAVSEGEIGDTAINIRGNHLNLGEKVPRGFLQIVRLPDAPAIPAGHSGRLELADWIARADHPLTGRVIVNRVWTWHFGEGLCSTPDNLGISGSLPTHPELLDWLTHRFVAEGWSLKRLHREILLSNTYQMSSRGDTLAVERDPENRWWSRFNRRRLEAEEFRDAILAVSGQLDPAVGGSLFNYPNREPHVTYYKGPVNYDFTRRSLYLPVVRNVMYELFDLFDHGDALTPLGKRDQTTVAPQSLYLMNSKLVMTAADQLAQRAPATAELPPEARLRKIYELAFNRSPSDAETAQGIGFIQRFDHVLLNKQADPAQRQRVAWQAFCQALLVSNAFLTVE